MVDPATFRNVMAQWPSGVTIVTTLDADGERKGMTASSFSSVSAEPPLVSICLVKTLYTHKLISESGVFGVNFLAKDQMEVARRFAGMVPSEDRFEGEEWTIAETGVSLLDSALGWVDCRVVHEYEGGDHTIFVGEVVAAHNARRAAPLLYHSRGWGQFADVLPDVATVSDSALVGLLQRSGLAAEVPTAVAEATAAGVRLRVADLTGGIDVDGILGNVPWPADRACTTVAVADRAQADLALAAGAGLVEFVVDPADRTAVAALVAQLDGIAAQSAVEFVNPFSEARHVEVVTAVEQLKAAGVKEICLPDTAGAATAIEVRNLLQEIVPMARPTAFRIRLDGSDRLGLVKGLTALKSGARDFDTALEGLHDSAAVEDLIRLLGTLDVDSTVDGKAITALAERLSTIETTPDIPTVGAAG
ncbi:flavin reductase [Nocardioides yefusunii]|uniref:Flavin reductase n=1 Tax=Nocardioides yefusunii TaxID=2500546 RepID=A0ABW1QUZ4_9ACTN|nr:flavin reductase [Nocardioides yefusunii]